MIRRKIGKDKDSERRENDLREEGKENERRRRDETKLKLSGRRRRRWIMH